MNVEILCSSRELFGADRSALRLAEALLDIGLSPTVIVPSDRPELGLSGAASERGIPTREERIAIASSRGVESLSAVLPARGRRSRADLTIFNTTAVLGSGGSVSKKLVIVREWLDPGSPRHRLLAARHRFGADAIVGVSSDVVGQWRKCIRGPAQQHVLHNWLDRGLLDRTGRADSPKERNGILCIGRFNRWKGQDALASAYEDAFSSSDDRPALRFVGAQPGSEFDAPATAIATRGRSFGWEVLPFTSDPFDHFQDAALVVVPSLQPEPFGTIVLEALAHGCCVIAFEGGGPSDMAKDFPGSIQLVPRSGPGLADALSAWWQRGGPALSEDARSHARQTLESRYSPETGAKSWRTVIDALTP